MNRFYGWSLALLLGACSVPSFNVMADDAGLTDPCASQTANGKSCGGACAACADGQSCDVPFDCLSSTCEENLCVPAPTCDDAKINGAETDADCGGGTCDACALDKHCTRGSDCLSALCDAGVCAAMPTCNDALINGAETDKDCGGGTCDACALDKHCTRARDCESGLCKSGVCATPSPDPTCTDAQKNGDESDKDCGGSCDPCAVDKRCSVGSDCVTLVCATVCQPPDCADTVRNGDETDKDCGGSCSGCNVGAVCKGNADCKSLSCSNGHCITETCTDNRKNGTETGIDCGSACPACGTDQGCAKAADCQSLVCTSDKCVAATCTDTVKNGTESEIDCGKGCKGCQSGQFCNTGADCASATCTQNFCVPTAPSGGMVSQAGWVATASDNTSTANLGIDNNLSTHWTSAAKQTVDMWYQVDMGKPQIFFSLTIDDTNLSGDAPQLFDVYLSLSPTFPSAPTVSAVAGLPKTKVSFAGNQAVVARYVKVVLRKNYPQNAWSIQELTASN
ncbi:MAG: discoidin domain-containing protein [Polyangiaceae bacterium]